MPTLVSEELDDWMKDMQADLQEALEATLAQAILGSSHFCSSLSLLCGTGVVGFGIFLLCYDVFRWSGKVGPKSRCPGDGCSCSVARDPSQSNGPCSLGADRQPPRCPGSRRREDVSAAKVLESAIGPEDGATKAGLEAALRRAKEQHKGVSPGRAPVPR